MHPNDSIFSARAVGRAALTGVSLLLIAWPQAQAQTPAQAQTQTPARAPGGAPAAQSGQPLYKTPEEAVQALLNAVKGADAAALKALLGDSGLVQTDQPELDVLERQQFAQKYGQMHRLARRTDGSFVLTIGPENWPFPVPIVAQDRAWRFDSGAGLREVVFRRIGENELTAIDVCHALVAAQREPTQHGAPLPEGDEAGTVITRVLATAQTGAQPVRFHGYEYRRVPGSDGHFMAVAYPAEYRSSGVMTFVVSQEDAVYEKDLGRRTSAIAQALKAAWQPSAEWRRVEEEEPKSP